MQNNEKYSEIIDRNQDVINDICNAAKMFDIDKIILFGSRAKGINSEYSDFDLLVYGKDFCEYKNYMTYDILSLERFDLSDGESANDELLNEIKKYGVIIYEKAE